MNIHCTYHSYPTDFFSYKLCSVLKLHNLTTPATSIYEFYFCLTLQFRLFSTLIALHTPLPPPPRGWIYPVGSLWALNLNSFGIICSPTNHHFWSLILEVNRRCWFAKIFKVTDGMWRMVLDGWRVNKVVEKTSLFGSILRTTLPRKKLNQSEPTSV